jgi:hypothetical protein
MQPAGHRQVGSRRRLALAVVLTLILSSLGVAAYYASTQNHESDVILMSIAVTEMGPDYFHLVGIFEPFDEDLRLWSLVCEPSVSGLNPLLSETNESAYMTAFHTTLSLDIHGTFAVGTVYQFTLRFLDEEHKVKTVYIGEEFVPNNTTLQTIENSPVQESEPASESFGDQQLFWTYLNCPESMELTQVRATLLHVGTHCYIYMANSSIEILGEGAAITKCTLLGQAFDEDVYPTDVEVAGDPDGLLGDIDGDPRVTVFLAPLVRNMGNAYLGYPGEKDEFPGPYSNEREMVYVDAEQDVYKTVCITIHEFNHMIWFNYEMDEADFLMEGLANLAVDLAGYSFETTDLVTRTYTCHPEISLLHFNRFYGEYWDASYGQAYLFVNYLYDRFGLAAVRNLVSTGEDGPRGVEIALAAAGYDMTFNELYLDFITACVLDDTQSEGGIYGFKSLNYTIQRRIPMGSIYPLSRYNVTHYHYGFNVYRLVSPFDNFTITVENPYPYALGLVVAARHADGWHVTQFQYFSASGQISQYVESREAQEVYLITTLMSHQTPTEIEDVYSLAEVPSERLDVSITEGDAGTRGQSVSSSIIFPVSILAVFAAGSIFIAYKRRSILESYGKQMWM